MNGYWTDQKSLQLIEAVKQHRPIYDRKCVHYGEIDKTKKIWLAISKELKEQVNSCKKQWLKLTNDYFDSFQKSTRRRATRKSKFIDKMSFLEPPDFSDTTSEVSSPFNTPKSKDSTGKLKANTAHVDEGPQPSDEICVEEEQSQAKPVNQPPIDPIIIRVNHRKGAEIRNRNSSEKQSTSSPKVVHSPKKQSVRTTTESNVSNVSVKNEIVMDTEVAQKVTPKQKYKRKNHFENVVDYVVEKDLDELFEAPAEEFLDESPSQSSGKRSLESNPNETNKNIKRLKVSKMSSVPNPTEKININYKELNRRLAEKKRLAISRKRFPLPMIPSNRIKTEPNAVRKLTLVRRDVGTQCEHYDHGDTEFFKSLQPQLAGMTERQKFVFKKNVMQALLDAMDDNKNSENNPSTAGQNPLALNSFLKTDEVRLINELASVVLATKEKFANPPITITSRVAPIKLISKNTAADSLITTQSSVQTAPMSIIQSGVSQSSQVSTLIPAQLITTAKPNKVFVRNVPNGKTYSVAPTINSTIDKPLVSSTTVAPRKNNTEIIAGNCETFRFMEEGGKIYKLLQTARSSEHVKLPTQTADTGTFLVPRPPKTSVQNFGIGNGQTAQSLENAAVRTRQSLNRRNSTSTFEVVHTGSQLVKMGQNNQNALHNIGSIVNIEDLNVVKKIAHSGGASINVSSPTKVVEQMSNGTIRIVGNMSQHRLANGQTFLRTGDINLGSLGGNYNTANNTTNMGISRAKHLPQQQIIQLNPTSTETTTKGNSKDSFQHSDMATYLTSATTINCIKPIRRLSVCTSDKVITTSANITPFDFSAKPLISSLDSYRAYRGRPETVTTTVTKPIVSGLPFGSIITTTPVSGTGFKQFVPQNSSTPTQSNNELRNFIANIPPASIKRTQPPSQPLTSIPLNNLLENSSKDEIKSHIKRAVSSRISVKPINSLQKSNKQRTSSESDAIAINIKKEPEEDKGKN